MSLSRAESVRKPKRIPGLIRRISGEILHKVRLFSDEVFGDDESVDHLFDSTRVFDKMKRWRGQQDESFLNEYRLYNSLDKMYEAHQDAKLDTAVRLVQVSTLEESLCGEELWEQRRARWLSGEKEAKEKVRSRYDECLLAHISRELYPRIYTGFVEQGKLLKRPINLKDLVDVVNAGWVVEERWERAAKGMA